MKIEFNKNKRNIINEIKKNKRGYYIVMDSRDCKPVDYYVNNLIIGRRLYSPKKWIFQDKKQADQVLGFDSNYRIFVNKETGYETEIVFGDYYHTLNAFRQINAYALIKDRFKGKVYYRPCREGELVMEDGILYVVTKERIKIDDSDILLEVDIEREKHEKKELDSLLQKYGSCPGWEIKKV